jgi:hypothetical protein
MEREHNFHKEGVPPLDSRLRYAANYAGVPREHWDDPQVRSFLERLADLEDLESKFVWTNAPDETMSYRIHYALHLLRAARIVLGTDPKDLRVKGIELDLKVNINTAISHFGLKVVDEKPSQKLDPANVTPTPKEIPPSPKK